MATQAYSAAREIREIEVELNQWVTVPFTGRGPNSSTSRLHANMLLRFERAFNTLNNISMDLKP